MKAELGIAVYGGAWQGSPTKLPVANVATVAEMPFELCVFVPPHGAIPQALVPAAVKLLAVWDAAVPLWGYHLAADVGGRAERLATKALVGDLRIPLHATELLFVRRNEAGQALMTAWAEELTRGRDQRLAFLRALWRVKPRLCVLPAQGWVHGRQVAPKRAAGARLAAVEVSPGRWVKCMAGQEEAVRMAHATPAPKEKSVNTKKGIELVAVEIAPGRFVKMRPSDVPNKMAAPPANKLVSASGQPPAVAAPAPAAATAVAPAPTQSVVAAVAPAPAPAAVTDFTKINGVGPATARLLASRGIATLDQLRTADVTGIVSPAVAKAIEEWRTQ